MDASPLLPLEMFQALATARRAGWLADAGVRESNKCMVMLYTLSALGLRAGIRTCTVLVDSPSLRQAWNQPRETTACAVDVFDGASWQMRDPLEEGTVQDAVLRTARLLGGANAKVLQQTQWKSFSVPFPSDYAARAVRATHVFPADRMNALVSEGLAIVQAAGLAGLAPDPTPELAAPARKRL